jgi:LemA protein
MEKNVKRDRINLIIKKAYANRYDLGPPMVAARPRSYFYLTKVRPVFARIEPIARLLRKRILLLLLIPAAILTGASIHYYNLLVISEQNMCAARGRVQALLQRRNDTATNMSKAVLDYAEHERALLSTVVTLRGLSSDKQADAESLTDLKTSAQKLEQLQGLINKAGGKTPPGSAPAGGASTSGGTQAPGGAPPSALMSLSALAEQYPDLKLSANFQTLMNALDQIEKDLAAERMRHDEMVNTYVTKVQIFPSNIFAKIFGFGTHPYFEATEGARDFKLINY